jgi:hypothetical protein
MGGPKPTLVFCASQGWVQPEHLLTVWALYTFISALIVAKLNA